MTQRELRQTPSSGLSATNSPAWGIDLVSRKALAAGITSKSLKKTKTPAASASWLRLCRGEKGGGQLMRSVHEDPFVIAEHAVEKIAALFGGLITNEAFAGF